MSTPFRLTCDRTGFPWLEWPEKGSAIGFTPTTKRQFERYLAEPTLGNAWYEDILALNPRVTIRDDLASERRYLTGVRPEEALSFCCWLSEGCDLLTLSEWRAWEAELARHSAVAWSSPPGLARAATECLEPIGQTLAEQLRFRGGVVEWVRLGNGYVGVGDPRTSFLAHVLDPARHVFRPLRSERLPYFGFRVARRIVKSSV